MTMLDVVAFDDLANCLGAVLAKHLLFHGGVPGHGGIGKSRGLQLVMLAGQAITPGHRQERKGQLFFVRKMALEAAVAFGPTKPSRLARFTANWP
jgi:hypothetical protein